MLRKEKQDAGGREENGDSKQKTMTSIRRERKQINKERRKINQGRMINKDILRISVVFAVLFLALMVYIGFFLAFRAETVVNNTYNKRSDTFKRTVRRGTIYDAFGNVLAETGVDGNGVEYRYYPYGNAFAQCVGFETNGGLGLESSYNYYLLASHVNMFEKIANEFNGTKNQGDALHTTLRADLQQFISDLMGDTMGGAIAINPATGEIYADVSKPDFDPNTIAENWEAVSTDEEGSPMLNRPTQGKYTPGSTFKIFTLLEYMRENPNFRDYMYQCEGRIQGDGYVISCFDGEVHGLENLETAFSLSCNCAFANTALALNRTAFQKNNEALLFNSDMDIDIAYNPAKFHITDETSDFMIMQTGFGQGETSSNPLHMALVMSAIANDGVLMKPHFASYIESPSGRVVKEFKNTKYKTLLSSSEAAVMNEYLRAVVTYGTAYNLNWGNYTAYGKTGTAETLSNKNENYDRSWFAGYGELNGEKLVLCVIVDNMNQAPMRAVDYAGMIFDHYFGQW